MSAAAERRFRPGDTAVVRYITRIGGRPGMSWPYRVARDTGDLVALYLPAGTEFARWRPGERAGRARVFGHDRQRDRWLERAVWSREVLRLMFPGRHHSVWLRWDRETGARRFSSYYVNLEEPFRRTPIGFDTNDHALDIVVSPDLEWRWKDEQQLDELAARGSYSPEFARSVREEGLRAIADVEARRPPFDGRWEDWEPDPSWERPVLPEGWLEVPVAHWDRRAWAYREPDPGAGSPRAPGQAGSRGSSADSS